MVTIITALYGLKALRLACWLAKAWAARHIAFIKLGWTVFTTIPVHSAHYQADYKARSIPLSAIDSPNMKVVLQMLTL